MKFNPKSIELITQMHNDAKFYVERIRGKAQLRVRSNSCMNTKIFEMEKN